MSNTKIRGISIQSKKTTPPATNIKICTMIPTITRNDLTIAPTRRENTLEIKVLKNSPGSKALGYLQAYLLQGEKNVLSKRGIEKKLAPNEI